MHVERPPKPDKGWASLREGLIDLGIGVLGESAPEGRTRMLFRDGFVGAARAGHCLLGSRKITRQRYAACSHVVASRRGRITGPVDHALRGLERTAIAVSRAFQMRYESRVARI
jgi:DNA-binding transcriptional LysR family regulator